MLAVMGGSAAGALLLAWVTTRLTKVVARGGHPGLAVAYAAASIAAGMTAALLENLERHAPGDAILLRGLEGFGVNRRIHAGRFPDASADLPLLAMVVGERERIREAGGAGVTTVLGAWGFSSDERPHGDRLGPVVSHRPTDTVYVDRPERVRRLWPVVDELTSAHGIVTPRLVPGYLERAGEAVRGSLEQADAQARLPAVDETRPRRGPSAREEPGRLTELRVRAQAFAAERGSPGVTLVPHPQRYDELVPVEGEVLAPRAVIVPEGAIAKVELLTRPPRGARSLVLFDPWPE